MTEQPPAPMVDRPAQARHAAAGWVVLAWLVATAGRFVWAAVTGFGDAGVPWWSKVATAAVGLLALAAVVPFLRFRRSGWEMAMWVLVTALVMDVARIVLGSPRWIPAALAAGASAFCLGWLWRARGAFAVHDDFADAVDAGHRPAAAVPSDVEASAPAAVQADPVADALGAIHRRIVEAGSACAVTREALLAEAARFRVSADALRREGIPLYRTFLDHFRADGPLTAEEDRELFCLESKLELDAIAVARLRSERSADRLTAPELVMLDDRPPGEPVHAAAEPGPVDDTRPVPPAAEPVHGAPAGDGADRTLDATYAPEPGAAAALADYEQHELSALLRWAGVALPANADARAALETLRAWHRVSTEPLEEVDPAYPLSEGERCYAVRMVDLYRMTPGAQPDASAAARGPLDAAAFVDGTLQRDCDLSRYQRAGACRFLVTDRRLLLVAPSGQQSPLPLDRIRAVQPHRNGVKVHPLRGSPVFLAFGDGVADVAMRIGRALNDVRGARPA